MFIELKNIKKSFNINKKTQKIEVLKGINLSIEKGEMIAIKGSSGSGKTTLLNIIAFLDKADEGLYTYDGVDTTKMSARKHAKLRNSSIGIVMQNFALIEDETVLFNVSMPNIIFSKSTKKASHEAMKMLEMIGIDNLWDKKVANLSGGEKQRVAIARALVNNPDVIIADEPTGSLDLENTQLIMNILKSLNEKGITIIIVTHEEYVANCCSRIIKISEGKIL